MNRDSMARGGYRIALFGVIAVLVWCPLAYGAVTASALQWASVLIMGAGLAWTIGLWVDPDRRVFWPPVVWVVFAGVALAQARYGEADLEYVARAEVLRIMLYALFFWLILQLGTREEDSHRVALTIVGVGAAIAAYGIFQFTTGSESIWVAAKPEQYAGRASGTFICPNHFSGYLELAAPVGLAYALSGRFPAWGRVMIGYASGLMLVGVGLSLSRAGWFSAGAGLALLFGMLLRRARWHWVYLGLAALLVVGGAIGYMRSVSARHRVAAVQDSQGEGDLRWALGYAAFRMWQDEPAWGVGPGHFDYRFPGYRPVEVQGRPGRVHNDYLNLLADWGLAGGLVVGAGVVVFLAGLGQARHYVEAKSPAGALPRGNRSALFMGASAGLFALAVHSFFDFNLHIPSNALVALTWVALLTGQLRFASKRYWVRPGTLGCGLMTLGLLGVSVWCGWTVYRSFPEQRCLTRVAVGERGIRELRAEAAGLAAVDPARERLLRQAEDAEGGVLVELAAAHELEPGNVQTCYARGELLRRRSWAGGETYAEDAREAICWFEKAARLDPLDPINPGRIGMCLDWLGQHDEATPFYREALRLDPNNHYLEALAGWHYYQIGEDIRAWRHFVRSAQLRWQGNVIARTHLDRIREKMGWKH